jgi:monoterpene epsilon-lactone hydrolase
MSLNMGKDFESFCGVEASLSGFHRGQQSCIKKGAECKPATVPQHHHRKIYLAKSGGVHVRLMQQTTDSKPFLHIPETVSEVAQAFLRTLKDPALTPPFPGPSDLEGWKKVQAFIEQDALAQSAPIVKRYAPIVMELELGGVPVLDVRPKGWTQTNKVAVYVHGGAHTLYSAKSTLGRAAIFADDTGHRVISVDYTLAPEAKFNQMSDEVITVIQALLKTGHTLADTLIYGDSSGGGLAAAVVLKMRDNGLGMPVAAVLVSPWLDVTPSGDTEFTLAHAEPNYLYDKHSKSAAGAFADPKDQKHPYASPMYGDFSKGFPPTLIQGGTKEILLSGFIRLYQALDLAGRPVKLDIYEGMPHNFASRIPEAPESKVARKKIADFVRKYLGDAPHSATASVAKR